MAAVPAAELGEREAGGDDEEEERGIASGGAATGVGGFGFG